MNRILAFPNLVMLLLLAQIASSQPVSGVWHGKVDARGGILKTSYRVELKLARQGDSLYGTCYYHAGRREYARFPVRGFFNPFDGTVSWWHAQGSGVDEMGRTVSSPVSAGASFVADFNCPGGEEMSLDGELAPNPGSPRGSSQPIHFEKVPEPLFKDEWDDALNDPTMDLAGLMGKPSPQNPVPPTPRPAESPAVPRLPVESTQVAPPREKTGADGGNKDPVAEPRQVEKTPEMLFERRRRQVVTEIPLKGDSLELHFYDHAEIDGDTISIFHNGILLQKHVLLKAEPFTLRFHVGSLPERNEFTMVAENLGRIPPNTSLLVAYVDGVRYEARLESTEEESASVRFDKPKGR